MFLYHELKKVVLRALRGIYSYILGVPGGDSVVSAEKRETKGHSANGVRASKSAVPKTGTKLTRERISSHFRSLNSGRSVNKRREAAG